LKPYTPRLAESYEVVIVGSGLGGLMAGAALAQAGYRVAVFEKLSFPGGRYTELDYKGAAVTTGAWTNLGPKSHIGRFLLELGLDLDYISLEDVGLSEQYSIRFPDGRRYANLLELLTPPARKAWLKAILTAKRDRDPADSGRPAAQPNRLRLETISTIDYLSEFSADPDLLAAVEAITATTSGLAGRLMPASEYLQITLDARQAGSQFAMPAGGVRAIIKALVTALRQAGGHLFVRSPVSRIAVEGGRVVGLHLEDGRLVASRVVIHNGGPGRFVNLVGAEQLPAGYRERLAGLKGVECAALFCATRQPLFSEAPMTMTPNCRRIVGIFAPTLLDATLSRPGLYLYDAFFPTYSADRSAELALALADMRQLFPNFDQVVAWFLPMFFSGSWPGTESGQTFGQVGEQRLDPVTPIENCYLVGMDVKGSGVAGDLIPLGVRQVLRQVTGREWPAGSISTEVRQRLAGRQRE
jgi:phytoene dehydrogenase-like protein